MVLVSLGLEHPIPGRQRQAPRALWLQASPHPPLPGLLTDREAPHSETWETPYRQPCCRSQSSRSPSKAVRKRALSERNEQDETPSQPLTTDFSSCKGEREACSEHPLDPACPATLSPKPKGGHSKKGWNPWPSTFSASVSKCGSLAPHQEYQLEVQSFGPTPALGQAQIQAGPCDPSGVTFFPTPNPIHIPQSERTLMGLRRE